MYISPRILQITITLLAVIVQVISDCHVLVQEPWPMPYIFIPRESTVEINCRAKERDYSPFWLIDLANDAKNFPLQIIQQEQLNSHGVYELPQIETPGMPPTLRLLINDTERNNQTVIQCDQSTTTISTTTLFVHGHMMLLLTVDIIIVDMGFNLSWSGAESQILTDATLKLSLGNNDTLNSQEISQVNESYYYFTTPKGAPPCEVYYFSVTATYVGATYTGASCSVTSPVLSTMLPSLPNISQLESSLDYVLKKQKTGISLYITFESASSCEEYPIMNYTLEIMGSLNEETIALPMLATMTETFTLLDNLSENAIYYFRILIANSVGTVSTSDRQFYTTDVQVVTAAIIKGVNTSIIQCQFIPGSTATGCMVVLTSEGQNTTYNLIRNKSINCSMLAVTIEHPSSHYHGVEAFDIESDGSIGSLPVPGQLINNSKTLCIFTSSNPMPKSITFVLILSWIFVMVAVLLVCSVIIILSIVMKRSKKNILYFLRCQCWYPTDDNNKGCEQLSISKPGEMYGLGTDGIETTPNEVYGVRTDDVETTPNDAYGCRPLP